MTKLTYQQPAHLFNAECASQCASPYLIICDHASNTIPPEYNNLGLTDEALASHIAWDIGAASVAQGVAATLDCPAVLSGFSRLLIDPNRGLDDPTLIMQLSEQCQIAGNIGLDEPERDARIAHYYQPYHKAIAGALARTQARGVVPLILSIHSFTPIWRGDKRDFAAGVLWDKDDRLVQHLLAALVQFQKTAPAHLRGAIGDNEPYTGRLKNDTLYQHGTAHGVPHAIIELRQDLVTDAGDVAQWVAVLADAMQAGARDEACQKITHYGSYCDI